MSPTTTIASVTTATTGTYTVVGTTPLGGTVTETSTVVTPTPAGPNGVAVPAGMPVGPETTTTVQGQTIDGIQCNRLDQLAYQLNAHVAVYVRGRPAQLPGGIGLINPRASTASSTQGTVTTYHQGLCTYWVRTVAANGVIEVRSPLPGRYTLGNLFDIWNQPLSRRQVAEAHGPVTAEVNGRIWHGNPRLIPIREHAAIQLAVGRPVPPFTPVNWSVTDL